MKIILIIILSIIIELFIILLLMYIWYIFIPPFILNFKKTINGYHNGNKRKFKVFCMLGYHDWYWTKMQDKDGNWACAVHCEKCNEMRALSLSNADMHDMNEVRYTIGMQHYSSMFFSWHNIPFEITDDLSVKC